MGGIDKPSLLLGERRLIDHVADRLKPQVEILTISANGDPSRFTDLGLEIRPDSPQHRAGPLAGLATMLEYYATRHADITHLVTAPADAPFLPVDLAHRLSEVLNDRETVAIASSKGRVHPVAGLWPIALLDRLERHLATAGKLSIMGFLDIIAWKEVAFPLSGGIDPLLNVNTPEDLQAAETLLARHTQS